MNWRINNSKLEALINDIWVAEGDFLQFEYEEENGKKSTAKLPIVFKNGCFYVDESFSKDGSYMLAIVEHLEFKKENLKKG